MQRTRPEAESTLDPQEEATSDIVTILHNEIQVVSNVIKEAIDEDESEIYFLKQDNQRLM